MTYKAGFPHSEIFGSMLVCQLPEAYRRLLRPSSPVIAKASTMCTYSLVPITLTAIGIKHLLLCFDELYYYPEHAMSRTFNKTLLLPDC